MYVKKLRKMITAVRSLFIINMYKSLFLIGRIFKIILISEERLNRGYIKCPGL